MSAVKKKAKRQKVIKRTEDSDEDDDKWIPGCEEVNRKRPSKYICVILASISSSHTYDLLLLIKYLHCTHFVGLTSLSVVPRYCYLCS